MRMTGFPILGKGESVAEKMVQTCSKKGYGRDI